tara:strand:+ start:5994 stop:6335 length:342 start_codon:yes stop_codon:yes gene_type:complete
MGLGGILYLAVGVVDQAGRRPLAFDGHVEGVERDFGVQGLAHGPADDLAGVHVEDGDEVELALAGRDVGQVGDPYLVGGRPPEVAGEPATVTVAAVETGLRALIEARSSPPST